MGNGAVRLSPIWLKAAVLGGLWASVEIIIGSFFHNLRLPFAGTILGMNATIMMIAFYQMWPEKGLIWRAGLIAALMKSVSPSAIILGPMIGIMSEALIIEFFIRLFGNHFLSLSLAGAISVSSALIHKVVSLLILYGFNIVNLYVDIYHFLARQARMEGADPWILVNLVIAVYLLAGFISAYLGITIGKRSLKKGQQEKMGFKPLDNSPDNLLSINPEQSFSLPLFILHIIMIPLGLIAFNYLSLEYSGIVVLAYALVCIWRYRQSLRRLRKPVFWFQLFLLTLLAAVFWNGFGSKDGFFGMEGFLIGIQMNIRALFVVVAFSSFGVELRNPVIRTLLFNKGFDRIYAALGLSFTALPVMIEAMPGPRAFLRYPVDSFSQMMQQAREWYQVFEARQDKRV